MKLKNNPKQGTTIYEVSSTSRGKPQIVDRLLMRPFVALVPRFVLPNQITIVRFILIPFVIWALFAGSYVVGFWVFVVAAFTDALDGAVARFRGQITDWGKLFDPIADKLLIGSTAMILVVKFLSIYLALVIILIEVWLITYNLFFRARRKKIISAKIEGKIKMILQCIGIGFVFLFAIYGDPVYLTIAWWTLGTAVFFGLLSLFVYKTI